MPTTPARRAIPRIAWGRAVVPGGDVTCTVNAVGTAATTLWLPGMPVPEGWEGRPYARPSWRTAERRVVYIVRAE